jgi:hypothetical protein
LVDAAGRVPLKSREPVAEPERISSQVEVRAVTRSDTEWAIAAVVVAARVSADVVVRVPTADRVAVVFVELVTVCVVAIVVAGAESVVVDGGAATGRVWCRRCATRNPKAAIARTPSAKNPFSIRVSGTRPG